MIKEKIYLFLEIVFYLTIPLFFISNFQYHIYIISILLISNIIIRLFMYKTHKRINENSCGCPLVIDRVIYNVFMSDEEKKLKKKTDWVLDLNKISERYNLKNQKTIIK